MTLTISFEMHLRSQNLKPLTSFKSLLYALNSKSCIGLYNPYNFHELNLLYINHIEIIFRLS